MAQHLDSLGERLEEVGGVDTSSTGRRERIEITKTAIREVMNEWLDARVDQFQKGVGKWSIRGIATAAFVALLYFILTHSGWKHT